MKALLFNLHDVVLMLTIGALALLTVIYLTFKPALRDRSFLLALFFMVNALIVSDILLYWSEAIRYVLFNKFSYLYMLLSAFHFVPGVLLYWLTRCIVEKHFHVRSWQWFHLFPCFTALVYLYGVCFQYGVPYQRALFLDFGLYSQPNAYFHYYVALSKCLPLGYALVSSFLLFQYQRQHSSQASSKFATGGNTTVTCLVYGYLFIWLWILLTHVVGRSPLEYASDAMGIIGNYLHLLLVFFILYDVLVQRTLDKNSRSDVLPDENHVGEISSAMTSDRVFLNSQLTLERLADYVNLTPREVSVVINRQFKQNFHEYLNSHRIDEAKRLLRDATGNGIPINDIARHSGFNSKATFNRMFKKLVGVTPTQYRQRHQSS